MGPHSHDDAKSDAGIIVSDETGSPSWPDHTSAYGKLITNLGDMSVVWTHSVTALYYKMIWAGGELFSTGIYGFTRSGFTYRAIRSLVAQDLPFVTPKRPIGGFAKFIHCYVLFG